MNVIEVRFDTDNLLAARFGVTKFVYDTIVDLLDMLVDGRTIVSLVELL